MSAFIVERHVVSYLAALALHPQICRYGGSFAFSHNGKRHVIGSVEDAAEMAGELWSENIASVSYLYRNSRGEALPGYASEVYEFLPGDLQLVDIGKLTAAEVFKTCKFYAYQSDGHPAWKYSKAKAFIDAVLEVALYLIEGFEEANWGAPEWYEKDYVELA